MSTPGVNTRITATPTTTCIVCGMHNRAVQGMLEFVYMCKCKKPSVEAMTSPFSGNHYVKFYWGTDEILMQVNTTTQEAIQKHPSVWVFVNFASFRSVHKTTMEPLQYPCFKTVAIIAEGVPERQTNQLSFTAE